MTDRRVTGPIRRIVADYETGMGVFWNTQEPNQKQRTNRAEDRFHEIASNCDGIPNPLTRLPILGSRKVRYLPFSICVEDYGISDVLLYGNYGEIGQIACWDEAGNSLSQPLMDDLVRFFLPPDDVNNLRIVDNHVLIDVTIHELYRRGFKKL